MRATDPRWGVLNIGFWEGFLAGERVHADLYESRNLDCGTHCYLVSAAAAAHFEDAALPMDVQLDSAMFMWLSDDGWDRKRGTEETNQEDNDADAAAPASAPSVPPRRFRPLGPLAWQADAADSDIQTNCLHAVADEWPEQHLRRCFA
jgi:hypothetical protein